MFRALALALALALAFLGAAARAGDCDPALRSAPLPQLAAALRTGQLSLLVVAPAGSATAPDTAADDGSLAFRIRAALSAQRPDLAIDLDRLDNQGQSVAEMLPQVAAELARHPAALVVWQAGLAELARGTNPDDFGQSLGEAARLAHNAAADLLLIDPDPAPPLDAAAAWPPIRTALRQASGFSGVALYLQHDFNAQTACTSHGIAWLIARA